MNNIIEGIIIKGKGRGKKLGFPTANIEPEKSSFEKTGLESGVYASIIEIDGVFYNSATSIGRNETFNEKKTTIETYIFNFDKDIYGKKVFLNLIAKVSNIKKFDSEEKLKAKMQEDIKKAKAILYQLKLNFH